MVLLLLVVWTPPRLALAEPTAKELFGAVSTPAPATGPLVIGSYAKGCLAGGVALPIDGSSWQAVRLSRNRNLGRPTAGRLHRAAGARGAGRRLARAAGRRHGAATRRADAHRPRLAPDRPRCRHLADAHARATADRRGARDLQPALDARRRHPHRRPGAADRQPDRADPAGRVGSRGRPASSSTRESSRRCAHASATIVAG